jgi:hypothetical protein
MLISFSKKASAPGVAAGSTPVFDKTGDAEPDDAAPALPDLQPQRGEQRPFVARQTGHVEQHGYK